MHAKRYQILALILGVFWVNAVPATALPIDDGIVTVDDRQFYVGPTDREWPDYANNFPLDYSEQLHHLLATDDALANYRIFLFQSGVPARALIQRDGRIGSKKGPLSSDPALQIPNMITYANPQIYHVFPAGDALEYVAICTGPPDGLLRFCRVEVVYPYAENVMLIADRFFPGTFAEVGPTFDAIAHRMIEIAICLDVTATPDADRPDSLDAVTTDHPELRDCKIDLLS